MDDDILVKNEKRVRESFEWLMTALFGTMAAGRGRFIMVGNRIAKHSILSLWAETKDIYHTVVNMLDKHGRVTWHENYTPEEVAEIRQTLGERKFYKEYMNSPVDEGSVFKLEWMHYGKILPLKEYVKIISYTDPSFRSSSSNDYKATILVGKTKEGYYHVLKAFAGQCSVAEMVSWHYQIEDWIQAQGGGKLPRYYMEANFIQDLLLDEFEKEGIARGGRQIPITGDKRKKMDKFSRIETMQPLFERGFILFNVDEKETEGMKILIEQLLGIEKGSRLHDDAPDALESAIYMLNKTGKGAGKYRIAERRDLSV
ncbi:phage terminase large subunit [Porphyromonas gingivicanis]|uniref:phage terminase large subunit n=1 Tax=Porphyromonas gingivicanis TaxID=266762 RepID=UPI000A9F604B|nr:phage terminase large subunit [Porphyromonas gingivicanis]